MDTISGIFICPKCGAENILSSLSDTTYYSTWKVWQKRYNKWIIGCFGYYENDIWWWDIFHYVHEEKGDKKCWNRYGGSTENEWIKKHYKWKCEKCGYYSNTFTDFIINKDALNDDNEDTLNNDKEEDD